MIYVIFVLTVLLACVFAGLWFNEKKKREAWERRARNEIEQRMYANDAARKESEFYRKWIKELQEKRWDEISQTVTVRNNQYREIQARLEKAVCPTNNHVWDENGVCRKCGRVKDA